VVSESGLCSGILEFLVAAWEVLFQMSQGFIVDYEGGYCIVEAVFFIK